MCPIDRPPWSPRPTFMRVSSVALVFRVVSVALVKRFPSHYRCSRKGKLFNVEEDPTEQRDLSEDVKYQKIL
eukprot:5317593-Amphidinium_carterae.1